MYNPLLARIAQKRTPELVERKECELRDRGAGAHAGRVGTRADAFLRPQELP